VGEVDAVLVGKRLRRLRDERNWSGAEAGEASGLTWPELRELETGQRMAARETLERLARAYERSVDALIGPPGPDDDPPPPPPPPPDTRSSRLRERSPYRPGNAARTGDDEWPFAPGDRVRRVDLHRTFGGNKQSGIAPSAKTPNVFVFSDPSGHEHGYYDRWDDEAGVFLYSGEGQHGDQVMDKGNAAILNHRRDGRRLRVFEGSGGEITYAGEFEVAAVKPYTIEQSHESGSTRVRKVFLFRLVPVAM
jgi:transcriptional regulator with XRE-family HTH domain